MAMELSSDLVEEILLCVPARSLERLRHTCKQWKTLISDPRFVKKHLSHMRCREQQFIVFNQDPIAPLSGSTIFCVGIDFNIPEKACLNSMVTTTTFTWPGLSSVTSSMSHCDGLLLYVMKSKLLVLNPLLKQARSINYCYGFENSRDVYFGLGYISNQSSSHYDYKIVRVGCGGSRFRFRFKVSRVEVYTFKSDSWKLIDKAFNRFDRLESNVCLQGTPYWLAYRSLYGENVWIQSFDFSKERFKTLLLPPSLIWLSNWKNSLSLGIFRGDELSLLHSCSITGKIHINLWVMQKQDWSMLMTVDTPISPIYGTNFANLYSCSFIENNGKLVLFIKTRNIITSIYIVGENQECQKVEYNTAMDPSISDCYYVPTLLQIPRREE